jgi:hypothetical protein
VEPHYGYGAYPSGTPWGTSIFNVKKAPHRELSKIPEIRLYGVSSPFSRNDSLARFSFSNIRPAQIFIASPWTGMRLLIVPNRKVDLWHKNLRKLTIRFDAHPLDVNQATLERLALPLLKLEPKKVGLRTLKAVQSPLPVASTWSGKNEMGHMINWNSITVVRTDSTD